MEPENNKDSELFTEIVAPPESRKRGKKKAGKIAIIAILSVFALLVGAGIYLINHYFNYINIIDPGTDSVLSPSEFAADESKYWQTADNPYYTDPETGEDPANVDPEDPLYNRLVRAPYQADAYRATLSADDEQVIFDHPVTPTFTPVGPLHDEDLINIMLVGQDTRSDTARQRSDTMILVSINPKTHKVALISFLRDLYVPIGEGYGSNRLNTAFRIGGLKKMYQVFENVFGIHIDGGIYINFGQFMSLVNLLGGIDVTLTETEAKWLKTTLTQSIPDMRYWGQIVEAKMPKIKSGTTVEDAIKALTDAKLSYAYADANGGVAPDDTSKAAVKALYLDAAGTTTAKSGTYYALQRIIYIKYEEARITFPTIPEEAGVESVVKLLTDNGFTVAYADQNGNAAPYDSKAALVTAVYREAEGRNTFIPGEKFAQGTTAYIAYVEKLATIPTIPAGATVADAEPMLKAAGLAVSWSALNGGAAPADKTKATLSGIWADPESTKKLKAGDKIDINATVYLSYELIEEAKAVMPAINSGTKVSAAEQALTAAGFTVAYADANGNTAPAKPDEATVEKITSDPSGSSVIAAGTEWKMGTVVYISYKDPTPPTEPSTEEPPTECTNHVWADAYTKNNNGTHTHTHTCSKCGKTETVAANEACYYVVIERVEATCTTDGHVRSRCSYCNYEKTDRVAALGHDLGQWTSNGDGTHSRFCSRCEAHEDGDCTYVNGICSVCGFPEPQPSSAETEPSSSETEPSSSETEPSSSETQPSSSETQTSSETEAPTQESTEATDPTESEAGQSNENLITESKPSAGGLYNPIVRRLSTSSASSDEPYYLRNIKAGRVHLDGMQALAYCRMRKLDSDLKRTERQRTVLNLLFNKVKSSSIATLNNLLEEILPQVTTDLSKAEILQIAAAVLPYFSSINLELHQIPAEGTYSFAMINGMAVVTMNQAGNIAALRSWLPLN